MKTRIGACAPLAVFLVLLLALGCLSGTDRASARERQLAVAKAKWPNPFDEIRHYVGVISEKDKKVLDSSFPDSTDWAILRANLAEVIHRSERSVNGIASVARSGRIEEYVLNEKNSVGIGTRYNPGTLRWAVRFLCNAAVVARDDGNSREAKSRLVTAVQLADSVGMSDEYLWHLVRPACLDVAYSTARSFCRYERIDAADAADLSYAFHVAARSESYMACLRSIWTASDGFRDLNAYVAIFDVPPSTALLPDAGGGSLESAPSTESDPLGPVDVGLLDTFRRDLDACASLRQSVLSTASWPFYTLPKNRPWMALTNGRSGTSGLPMTLQAEQFVRVSMMLSNNELAHCTLLDIVFSIRGFEAAKNRLPETLEELDVFVRESAASDYRAWFPERGFIDVYSGEPCKYTVTRDAAGKAVSFKVYSVGIDLKDGGGVQRFGDEREALGSDIVFEGAASTTPASRSAEPRTR